MKVIFIECDAEEMRANRTIMDSLSEAFGSLTKAIAGIDCTPEMISKAMAEKETIESTKEDMCDNYCKYPNMDDCDMDSVCENCPLNNI